MESRKNGPRDDEDLKRSVLESLEVLDEEDRLKVLEFSRGLGARGRARDFGGALLAFAGSIPKEDLAEMRRAIEEGCEKVDEGEW